MKKDLVTAEIIVKENKVGILRVGNVNYISLTDLAKYQKQSMVETHLQCHQRNGLKELMQ